jgi:hypothetical protein
MADHASGVQRMEPSFDLFAGTVAIGVGAIGLLYSIAFVVNAAEPTGAARFLTALFLMLGGLGSIVVLVALYYRLRSVSRPFALLGLLLGFAGAIGSAVHGGYDLANIIEKPQSVLRGLPNAIDPRGMLSFGLSALAVFVLSWLILRGGGFPPRVGRLGYVLGVLLVILYLGRLVIVDSDNLVIVVPALIAGVLVNPAWYISIGRVLRG